MLYSVWWKGYSSDLEDLLKKVIWGNILCQSGQLNLSVFFSAVKKNLPSLM